MRYHYWGEGIFSKPVTRFLWAQQKGLDVLNQINMSSVFLRRHVSAGFVFCTILRMHMKLEQNQRNKHTQGSQGRRVQYVWGHSIVPSVCVCENIPVGYDDTVRISKESPKISFRFRFHKYCTRKFHSDLRNGLAVSVLAWRGFECIVSVNTRVRDGRSGGVINC